MLNRSLALQLVAASVWIMPQRTWAAEDLLVEVRAGNQSAIESMRTIYCRVSRSSPTAIPGFPSEFAGEYWGSSDSWRVRSIAGNQHVDSVCHESIHRSAAKGRDPNGRERIAFSIAPALPDEPHGPLDVPGLGLLKLCGPKGCPLTLNELLRRPHELHRVRRETEEGREQIVVSLSLELLPEEDGDYDGHFEIWFDPQRNYLASKLAGRFSAPGGKKSRRESQVVSFKEVAPTVYFPEHVETRFYTNGELTQHDIVKFSEIRVNEPLPANIFELEIPRGARVFDAIQGKEYQVNASGKRFGPEKSLARFAPLAPGVAKAGETREEPKPLSRWIVPGSIGVLILATSLWIFQKWRSREAR